ncbi:CPBP family intramembrane glutamic endopeptidase [Yunchengibacter salinarum]|uniref:CPBP family intramembrane glutamic endopeptidase n=1 Tax=Yunchengibacter salinarum TaxID=3133399 RepID=UPI0035B61491
MAVRKGTTDLAPLGVFLLVLGVLSALAYTLLIELGLIRNYLALLMWAPGLAALATVKLLGLSFSDLGWRWPGAGLVLKAYGLGLALPVLAYGLVWSLGLGGVVDDAYLTKMTRYLGMGESWPIWAKLGFVVLVQLSIGFFWHATTTIGEEIGFRGFLQPLLQKRLNGGVAAVLIGLGVALWHAPLIYYTDYGAGPRDLGLQMGFFTLLMVGQSLLLAAFRLASNSIWPGAALRGVHNVAVFWLLSPMTVAYDSTRLYEGEFGLILPALTLAAGLLAWRWMHRRHLDQPLSARRVPVNAG